MYDKITLCIDFAESYAKISRIASPSIHPSQVMHPAFLSVEQLEKECHIAFKRASGPGGQNRNKVETAVEFTHISSGISGSASERRAQHENRRVALDRLRINLAVEMRTLPSEDGGRLFAEYVHQGRIAVSETNRDWPPILAELLNRLAICDWEVAPVAQDLTVSSSQLIKILKQSSIAWIAVNRKRTALGKHAFK